MRIGYLDCFAGASGDMILGALIDAGLPLEALTEELKKLPLSGYQISARPATRGVITGTQVTVEVSRPFGQATPLSAVLDIIDSSTLPPPAKKRGRDIFQRLAAAEARVHWVPLEEVRMHQVGAMDAIVDVMGAVIGLELMGLEALYSSPFPSGSGIEDTDHGVFPFPAPATLEILAGAGAPLRPSPTGEGELLTPTGAAIITTLASFESPLLFVERIGYGVGSRNPPKLPNVLPLWIGESSPLGEERELLLLETNIDDRNPELFGHVMEQLF
ncbi:MAG: LarC family nickel insertion protein, partial [Dehalococcoidia bacterium]